jgi:hypothetical protein
MKNILIDCANCIIGEFDGRIVQNYVRELFILLLEADYQRLDNLIKYSTPDNVAEFIYSEVIYKKKVIDELKKNLKCT